MGALIIMACRDFKKTQTVADKIKKMGLIQPIILNLDLSDLRSVEKCVADLNKSSIHKIDILINNAGVMALPQR
jgi:NADP-dependent 3-hydroxy acid dehydrogenase YdfG